MYCHKCGGSVLEDARFCESCGTPVTVTNQEGQIFTGTRNTVVHNQDKWSLGRLVEGRLGRMRYFTGGILALTPFFIIVSVWGLINILTGTVTSGGGTSSSATSDLVNVANNIIIPILFAAAFIFWAVAVLTVAVRRCHDFGYTGWFVLTEIIPYAGAIFGLYILFKNGDSGVNKYGPPPISGRRFLADVFNY